MSKSLPLLSVVWGTLTTLFAATSAANQLTHPLIPSWIQLGGLVVRMCPLTRFKNWLLRFTRSISHDFLAPEQWLEEFQSNFNLSVCVSISWIRKYFRVTVGWSRLSSWLSIDELKSISITKHCCAKEILTHKKPMRNYKEKYTECIWCIGLKFSARTFYTEILLSMPRVSSCNYWMIVGVTTGTGQKGFANTTVWLDTFRSSRSILIPGFWNPNSSNNRGRTFSRNRKHLRWILNLWG